MDKIKIDFVKLGKITKEKLINFFEEFRNKNHR